MQEIGLALNLNHVRRKWVADLERAIAKAMGAREETYGGE